MARYGEEKRWYQSPWVWGGAGCCFGCVVVPILLVVIAGGAGFAAFHSAGGLKEGAMEYLEQTPEAVAALGEPVEAGWQIRGSFNVNNDSGDADFAFPVHGSKGDGWLEVVAERIDGEWYYRSLALEVDETGERIFIPTPDSEPLREMEPPPEAPLTPEAPVPPEVPENVEET